MHDFCRMCGADAALNDAAVLRGTIAKRTGGRSITQYYKKQMIVDACEMVKMRYDEASGRFKFSELNSEQCLKGAGGRCRRLPECHRKLCGTTNITNRFLH